MKKRTKGAAQKIAIIAVSAIMIVTGVGAGGQPVAASTEGAGETRMKQMEYLNRGLVAATTPDGAFLSWRLLADEATGHTASGLSGSGFYVYRDGERIAYVTDSTNYLDREGTPESQYSVSAVVYGEDVYGLELERSPVVQPWDGEYMDLPLKKPADGVTPAGEAYTYSANDMSVGDVDGDGEYELFVKWDPSNAKDVSQKGYTGNTYIDAYRLDGTLLYRIDLGENIRSGAHYTQFMVYDFDGDGKAELMFKTAPGTKVIPYGRKAVQARHVISRCPNQISKRATVMRMTTA